MRARVKDDSQYPTVQSAGLMWLKVKWLPVPAWAEREISACPYLEVETLVEVTEPQTVEDKATKMIMPRKSAKVRKV
jgi:hypothetical protein